MDKVAEKVLEAGATENISGENSSTEKVEETSCKSIISEEDACTAVPAAVPVEPVEQKTEVEVACAPSDVSSSPPPPVEIVAATAEPQNEKAVVAEIVVKVTQEISPIVEPAPVKNPELPKCLPSPPASPVQVEAQDKAESNPKMLIENYLKNCLSITKPPDITLDELINASRKFPIDFPIKTICCEYLRRDGNFGKDVLEKCINSAYPVVHENVISLYTQFLEHKKMYGTDVEKIVYSGMNLIGLVQRLLDKRPVMFCGPGDSYILLDGTRGRGNWNIVGTMSEISSGLQLANCLSYDEIKLSAFLSVSSYSVFINDGNRDNWGMAASTILSNIERDGVVVGLIGARFEKHGLMEWQEIIVSKEQNTIENGYGSRTDEKFEALFNWRHIWSDFYDIKPCLPLYDEVKCNKRYQKIRDGFLYDNEAFAKRLSISFETLLLEGNHRAKLQRKKAYIHMVGIGLGVWRISKHQEGIFLDAFASSLTKLLPLLTNVSDVNFSWFSSDSCGGVTNGKFFTKDGTSNKIRIFFSKRNPHVRLAGEHSGKLLIVSYPWDGNALPGNEFWSGMLAASGDPAQAASSQIAELHNPHINSGKVSGNNLHVATAQWGVIHIAEYAKQILNT